MARGKHRQPNGLIAKRKLPLCGHHASQSGIIVVRTAAQYQREESGLSRNIAYVENAIMGLSRATLEAHTQRM